MTDPDPALDELASAHLDGVTTPEEAARVERDPELLARVEELSLGRDRLRSAPTTSDPATRDRLIERALDAAPAPEGSPRVVPLRRRQPWRDPRWLGAAAAILAVGLLAGAIGLLAGENGDDALDAAADSPAESAESAPAEPDPGDDDAGAAGAAGADGAIGAEDLGDFGDLDDLRESLEARLDAAPERYALSPGADDPRDGIGGADPDDGPGIAGTPDAEARCGLGEDTLVHTATVAGDPVLIGRDPSGLVVLDETSCSPLDRVVP